MRASSLSLYFHQNQWSERYIDDIHRNAFSTMPYSDYFDRYLDINFKLEDTLYLLVGSDSGLLARYALSTELGRGSKIVLVEPDHIHELVQIEIEDLLQADGVSLTREDGQSMTLYSESNWKQNILDDSDRKWMLGGQLLLVRSQACAADFTHEYQPLFRRMRKSVEVRKLEIQSQQGGRTFIEKQIHNVADNINPLQIDEEFGKGYTAVVLGGSPSLDNHIDWIMENRDRLFIIAISRLCKRLQSLSLVPDVVLSVDPYQVSYDISKHGILWKDVPLISAFHVIPQLLAEWQGPKMFLGSRLPWHPPNDPRNLRTISAGGPTVSHTAIVVASQLGFTTILLSGVDLCYSGDLSTHAHGTPEAMLQRLPTMCDAQVETYSGRMAGTSEGLLHTATSLETIGKAVNAHQQVLFNLSIDATKIDSIPHIDYSDVLLPSGKPDFSHVLEKLDKSIDDRQALSKDLHNAKKSFELIHSACKRAFLLIDNIYSESSENSTTNYNAGLDRIEQSFDKKHGPYITTIRQFAKIDFARIHRPTGFAEMTNEEREEWIRIYYKIIKNSASTFIKMITDAQQRLQLRQQEDSAGTNFHSLIEAWKKDDTPGRILQFINTRRLHDAKLTQEYEQAKNKFLVSLNDTDTYQARKLKNDNHDIDNCMCTLLFMFRNKSCEDLRSIEQNLNSPTWPFNVLYTFTQGLLAEIGDKPVEAGQHYQLLINICTERLDKEPDSLASMQRIIEESLVRMTQSYVTIGDYDSACSSLGTLCEMLPQYIVSYAKLLNLTEQPDYAINILNLYIENYPNHWRAIQLTSDIYKTQGRLKEAELANKRSLEVRYQKTASGNNPTTPTTSQAA